MNEKSTNLFTRFAQISFFHYSVLAVTLAFFPILFRERGFSAEQIGVLGTLSVLASVLGQGAGVWITHRWLAASRIVYLFPILGIFFLSFLFLPLDSFSTFAVVFLFDCCHHGLIPQTDSQLLQYSSQGLLRFERVRLFGSIGFIFGSILLGILIDTIGVTAVLPATFLLMLCILYSASRISQFLPDAPDRTHTHHSNTLRAFFSFPILSFFLIVALQWASHAALYVYLSVYLRELGWSGRLISLAWNLGVIAEILVFFLLRTFDSRISPIRLLQLSMVFGICRWLILANCTSWPIILSSQALHGFSFGSFLIASLKILDTKLPLQLKRKGPALLSTLGHGMGSLTGRGILAMLAMNIHTVQDYQSLFFYSAGFASVGLGFSFYALRESKNAHVSSAPSPLSIEELC